MVADDVANRRFLLSVDGVEAELVYRRRGGRLTLVHTGVPEELGGRGIGGRLVSAAVVQARQQGLTVVPICPYARRWLRSHPEAAGDVTIDWPPTDAVAEGARTARPGEGVSGG